MMQMASGLFIETSPALRALRLLAVDRKLCGVVLTSPSPPQKRLFLRLAKTLFAKLRRLPASISEDRLLGGIELEQTLRTGRRQVQRGLLAEAAGGALYLDDLNLFEARIWQHLAAALDTGVVRVERDGLSLAEASDFVVLACAGAEETGATLAARQRLGLLARADKLDTFDKRYDLLCRALELEIGGARQALCENDGANDEANDVAGDAEVMRLCQRVEAAKQRLPEVETRAEDLARLAEAALLLGIEGNRADGLALRTARAQAALDGRDGVSEADLLTAIELVLLPRATRLPEAPTQASQRSDEPDGSDRENSGIDELDNLDGEIEKDAVTGESATYPSSAENVSADAMGGAQSREAPTTAPASKQPSARQSPDELTRSATGRDVESDELLRQALAAWLAADDLPATSGHLRLSKPAVEGRRRGDSRHQPDAERGRAWGSSARQMSHRRLAIAATLAAAAPFQRLRQTALCGQASQKKMVLTAEDLRYRRFKRAAATLFLFAVDASGSMALNRLAQAKGAMLRLLQDAYVHRDQVALVTFRRQSATLLLAPTRSVELAKRLVEAIPAGGATPLAAGLWKALEVARHARLRGISRTVLFLFTDGRANVSGEAASLRIGKGMTGEGKRLTLEAELHSVGAALRRQRVAVVLLDTKPKFILHNDARRLAEILGAHYRYLPRADERTVAAAVRETAQHLRASQRESGEF